MNEILFISSRSQKALEGKQKNTFLLSILFLFCIALILLLRLHLHIHAYKNIKLIFVQVRGRTSIVENFADKYFSLNIIIYSQASIWFNKTMHTTFHSFSQTH